MAEIIPKPAPSPAALPSQTSGAEWRSLTFDQRYCLALDVAASVGYILAKPASEPESKPNFCESCAMDAATCDCVNPKQIHVDYAPSRARPASEPAGGGVPVKPLVWLKRGPELVANTPFGRYEIMSGGYWCGPNHIDGEANGQDEAKAAAQADYEQRIRSALSSPASSSPAEASVEFAFGHGRLVIEGGLYGGKHAVFVYPAKIGGPVNTSAACEERPDDRLIEGEIVLTFPTKAQADYVTDALYNRERGSGFKDATAPAEGIAENLSASAPAQEERT